MKDLLRFLYRYIIFWLFVFLVNRIVFLISASAFFDGEIFFHVLKSLWSGWLLDIATTGYLLPVPGLLITLYILVQKKWLLTLCNFVTGFFIVIYCLLCFGELFLYQEWTTKLTMQALLHFQHPAEVFRTSPVHVSILFFFLSALFSTGYYLIYKKQVALKHALLEKYKKKHMVVVAIAALLIFIPVNFLMIRGGIAAIPISDSDAYYSSNSALNDAAVNPLWSLAKNILEYTSHQEDNPYVFMSDEEATAGLNKIMRVEKDTTELILTTSKPNIVFIILEGFTSYALPNFGGDNYAP